MLRLMLRPERIVFAALVALVSVAGCRRASDLPKLYAVPDAKLVTDAGKPLQLASVKGNVVVYDFIFTNCGGSCPIMSRAMQKVSRKIDPSAPVRFVSVSVDPTRDTPQVLREYRARLGADDRWLFLTGDRDSIVKLSIDGFKLAAGGAPQPGNEPLLHSSKFIIADRSGMVRAYISAIDEDGVEKTVATVRELLRE
jgi:protein SCO1/2